MKKRAKRIFRKQNRHQRFHEQDQEIVGRKNSSNYNRRNNC